MHYCTSGTPIRSPQIVLTSSLVCTKFLAWGIYPVYAQKSTKVFAIELYRDFLRLPVTAMTLFGHLLRLVQMINCLVCLEMNRMKQKQCKIMEKDKGNWLRKQFNAIYIKIICDKISYNKTIVNFHKNVLFPMRCGLLGYGHRYILCT